TTTDCVYDGNLGVFGGAIRNARDSAPRIESCGFFNNVVEQRGGGIYNVSGASPRIVDCTFVNNQAVIVQTLNGDTVPSVLICGDIAETNLARGGAICSVDEARPIIIGSRFVNNIAADGGAIASLFAAETTVMSSMLQANDACFGGALFASKRGQITTVNTVMARNAASVGAAALCRDNGVLELINCTIADHVATDGGALEAQFGARLIVRNSIAWQNTPASFVADAISDLTVRSSIVDHEVEGLNVMMQDPQFIDAMYRLAATSPARDAGSVNEIPADVHDVDDDGNRCERIDIDIDGTPRFQVEDVRGTSNCDAVIDCGAYEGSAAHTRGFIWGDITANGTIDTDDLVALLIAFGPCDDCCFADVNANGIVNVDDLVQWTNEAECSF
ncbi:MAG: hypothetical protein AAF432_13245, partial [Planctomycetota bacterium]